MMPFSTKKMRIINLLLLTLCGLLLSPQTVWAQDKRPNILVRYINRLINDTTESSRPQFIAYPTLAYAPETSWEFGFSGLYVYYANRDTTNRLSEISGFTFFTLQKQYGLWLDNSLYSHNNNWFVLGKTRFQSYPLLYHGIGPEAPEEHIAQVNAITIQMRQRVLRKIYPNLYLGGEFDFQRLSSVDFVSAVTHPIIKPLGHEGSTNLELGMGLIYDNCHNALNVRHGVYSELAFLHSNKAYGSDYTFTSIVSDNRFYFPMNKRDVLAFQVVGQFNKGNTPFNQLALMGGENLMRGYYYGRYRANNLIAAQIEYRMLPLPFRFTKRWGLAGFISTGTVFDQFVNLRLDQFVLAGGGGIRFLLFPKKDIYTRVDVAFTHEGPGLYIYVGEAF
jgi:Omp85 superfamily domain